MKRTLLLILLLAVMLSLSMALIVVGCGDDDDDDDDGSPEPDDDDDDDDDNDDSTPDANADEVYEQCVQWYMDCADLEEDVAQDLCGIILDAENYGQCRVNAFAAWLECVMAGVNCENWYSSETTNAVESCNKQLESDLYEC